MNGDFQAIGYSEIDLDKTKLLLEQQGLLLVDLGWFRAHTLMALLEEERKLNERSSPRTNLTLQAVALLFDMFRLIPLVLLSSNLVVLHCIFVNHCNHVEWQRLETGKYRFTLI
jgi:hypothetical protein